MRIPSNNSLVFPFKHSRTDNYISNKFVVSTIPYKRIEQKLFELFVNQIDYEALSNADDNTSIIITIPRSEIVKYLTIQQSLSVTKSMMEKSITFLDFNRPEIEYEHITIFSRISYQNGFLEFETNHAIGKYLKDFKKQYARYNLEKIQSFKYVYSSTLYRILRMHIGQKRLTFAYTIAELKKLLQVDEKKYTNFYDFNINVLSKAHKEITELNIDNIQFDYNTGNKQRGVEKIYFTIHTAFTNSELEKNEFLEAVSINPNVVLHQVEIIIDKQYHFRANHKKMILEDKDILDKFITLHIEFENGLHSNVKNKTAYILTCLNLLRKKA
ncbi:replication initiation protein [Arcicella sp. LKC2W]|uniref:replication initiation protein n=1 Tax=Arcicella sp. LKC2W TaxID=2984198 RepID=UPI002B1FEEA0|nr:replication initiation protein [Arcicella sp. LKC2W]MEA5461083.1 replication initiation protein [Arcicella sp. LKC2W]